MADKRVLIIGGGLAGVTTLYELSARGVPALLLDAAAKPASGASHANGGVLHPSLPDPWNNPGVGKILAASLFNPRAPMRLHLSQVLNLLGWGMSFLKNSAPARHRAITRANFALADYSTRQTEALEQKLNLQYEQAAPGTLKLLRNDEEARAALAMADMLATAQGDGGGLRYDYLDRAALGKHEPAFANATDLVGAVYFPDDRVGNARLFCDALLAAAKKQGGEVRLRARVESLQVSDGAVTGVHLVDAQGQGEVLHGDVVLCAGAASTRLAQQVGMRLPVRPAKGYSLTLPAASLTGSVGLRLRHPFVDPQLHIAVTPMADKIRILGMAEFAGFDTDVKPARLAMLRRFFEQLLPEMAASLAWNKAEGWAGLRPMSADGRPFIGAAARPGLWVNCGHGHLGWTMAVGSARLLADLYLSRQPEIDATAFHPSAALRRL